MANTGLTGVVPSTSAAAAAQVNANSKIAKTGDNAVDKDMFLKLLVAQLKYQDPSNPADSSQFLAQTAQFTLVEKMEALSKSQADLVTSSQLSSATSLVGSDVTYLQSGVTSTGTVTGVSISNGVPTLLVGDTKVELSQVSKVTAAAPAGTTPATPTPATPSV